MSLAGKQLNPNRACTMWAGIPEGSGRPIANEWLTYSIVHAKARSLVIISAHIGPNWGEPSPAMRRLAYELLDLGGDVYWGHSNHTPQGVEIYKDKVIMYSTGDFRR